MSGSLNKAIIIGNLGRDPEIKTFQDGSRVCNLAVATSETWKDKSSGERKERTTWHNVVVRVDGLVEVLKKHARKGDKIYVEGQLQTRKYEKDGQDHYATDIVVKSIGGGITLIGSARKNDDHLPSDEAEENDRNHASNQQSNRRVGAADHRGAGEPRRGGHAKAMEDEIPFSFEWR